MKQLEYVVVRNSEKLEGILNEDEKQIFEKYNDSMHKYTDVSKEQSFCDGFCLGARITMEAILSQSSLCDLHNTRLFSFLLKNNLHKKEPSRSESHSWQQFCFVGEGCVYWCAYAPVSNLFADF